MNQGSEVTAQSSDTIPDDCHPAYLWGQLGVTVETPADISEIPNPPGVDDVTNAHRAFINATKRGELLSKEEELGLVLEVQAGKTVLQALLTEDDHARQQALRAEARQAAAARQRLVVAHIGLVISIANASKSDYRHRLDRIQDGFVGLMRAIERYDPARGASLATYARKEIQRSVAQGNNEERLMRLPYEWATSVNKTRRYREHLLMVEDREPTIAEVMQYTDLDEEHARRVYTFVRQEPRLTLDEPQHEGQESGAEAITDEAMPLDEQVGHRMVPPWLMKMKVCLTAKERQALYLCFFAPDTAGMTLDEVADSLGIRRNALQGRLKGAFKKLRRDPQLQTLWEEE